MRKQHVRVICLSLLAATGALEHSARGASQAARTLAATRTKVAPTIDGNLDDACWKAAAEATGFSVFKNPDESHPQQTIGRVCFDHENLYISMECKVAEMDPFRKRIAETAGRPAWGSFDYYMAGVIEVFLDINHDRKTYQQYLLHANGSSHITLPKDDPLKILNAEHLGSAAIVTDVGYNVEMSFPLAMLHLRPDTAKVWGFNLNRVHDTYGRTMDNNVLYSSWNSTRGVGFQTPSHFGNLVMNEDFSRFYWWVEFTCEPQAGDAAVELRIKNGTGRDFSGTLAFSATPTKGNASEYEKPISLKAGQETTVSFKHFVLADRSGDKYKVVLSNSAGKVRYLGGMQTLDLTPGDKWAPPPITEKQTKAGYIVFSRPYTDPVLHRAVPRADEITSALSLSACRGEFEPIAFSLYPLRSTQGLQVSVGDLVTSGGRRIPASSVDVRKVMRQSIWKNPKTFEAREHLLRRFNTLDLVEGRTRRLWLTVKVPDEATAGEYRGTIVLSAGTVATQLPLTVRVLPFELSGPDGMGYFMYHPGVALMRGRLGTHKSVSNSVFFRKTLQDMRDHGMTTFTVYNSWNWVKDPKTGKPKLDVDSAYTGRASYVQYGVSYSRMIDMLRQAGLGTTAPLLEVSMGAGAEQIVEMYKIYQERGWPEVAFYIGDEIDFPDRIAKARKVLVGLKKAAPHIKTATALGEVGSEALGDMYDLWIGPRSTEMIEICRSKGKQPWTYSCRQIHEVGCAYERYLFGRFAWKQGLRGVGLWCYVDNNTMFDRFGRGQAWRESDVFSPEWKHLHGHVWFENGEIIPVVTWEAVREGIDDYRYMLTLKKAAQAAISSGNAAAGKAGQAGLKLLKDISDRTDPTPAMNESSGSKYLRDSKYFGDPDAEQARVIEATLDILNKTKR